MPIVVASPLGAAANTAAAFMQGQQERAMQQRAAALAQQKQNSEDALQAAQAQMYLGHGAEFTAQGNQRDAETPAFVARLEAQGFKLRSDGNYENAKGQIILPAQAALMAAQATNQTAQAGANTALGTLRGAQSQVALKGTLPFLQAKTAYTNTLPAYNNAKIAAMMSATNERGFAAAQSTAARINVAGMDETGRLVLGQMVNDRIASGDDEQKAMQGALAQYRVESQAYTQQMGANNKATAAGQATPYPNAVQPTFRNPQQSQGGVNLTVNVPSAGVTQGPNGMPAYNAQPARSINVQGEVGALKNALATKNNSAVQQRFNARTDLSPQQKALIWTSANQPTQQPATSPGAFNVPLSPQGGPPSVGGSAFNMPQTPFQLPGTGQ